MLRGFVTRMAAPPRPSGVTAEGSVELFSRRRDMSRNRNRGICCAAKSASIGSLGFAAVSSLLLLILGCGRGSSSTSPGNQTTPPTNLVYPQPTVTATVGNAISVDTPKVTGTVSSYAVSPALPAGLSLSTSSGAISGTPTATSAKLTQVPETWGKGSSLIQ